MGRTCWERAVEHVAGQSAGAPMADGHAVTLNFHPDAPFGDGLAIEALMIEAMAREGVYRSQFETRTSNGGLTAHPGGDRWTWESRMFGRAYDDQPPHARPKYGALNHRNWPVGGSPRFGSAHLRLRPHVLARTTFCYPDSHLHPEHFGVRDRMALIALADRNPAGLEPLDDYVEAHVHGPLRLDQDVAAIVLDPSHRGTRVEQAAARLPCLVEWHPGFRLRRAMLEQCAAYRNPQAAALLETLFDGEAPVTPRDLGRARGAGLDPQVVKQAWHCLARFGAP